MSFSRPRASGSLRDAHEVSACSEGLLRKGAELKLTILARGPGPIPFEDLGIHLDWGRRELLGCFAEHQGEAEVPTLAHDDHVFPLFDSVQQIRQLLLGLFKGLLNHVR